MEYTFYGAAAFNGDVGRWDTCNLESTENMFREALSFDRGRFLYLRELAANFVVHCVDTQTLLKLCCDIF